MKSLFILLVTLASTNTYPQTIAEYKVQQGKLHSKGSITIRPLPEKDKYKVEMAYQMKKKDFVPIPEKLLKGKTIIEFPNQFRSEAGYKDLEVKKSVDAPKGTLYFVKRADIDALKNAYFFEIHPKNKKSKLDVVYHPTLPGVGWYKIELTFLSKIPVLNGYEIKADLRR